MIPPLNWRAFYATDFPIASIMNTQTLEHTFWDYGQGWKLEAVATLILRALDGNRPTTNDESVTDRR
jgi:hypothetical protein